MYNSRQSNTVLANCVDQTNETQGPAH